jgi:hypothetical protein
MKLGMDFMPLGTKLKQYFPNFYSWQYQHGEQKNTCDVKSTLLSLAVICSQTSSENTELCQTIPCAMQSNNVAGA